LALDKFSERWNEKYPQISRSWQANWHNLNTLFDYPEDIRKAIYTTNAIGSVNSVIRKVIKKRKLFPSDDSAKKVVYLAIQDASKKWTMPIRNWKQALNRFIIEFEKRWDTKHPMRCFSTLKLNLRELHLGVNLRCVSSA